MDAPTETNATNMRWKGPEGTRICSYRLARPLVSPNVYRRFCEDGLVGATFFKPKKHPPRTSLNLARNQLLTLPDVWNLPLLKHLDFSFNNLSRQLGCQVRAGVGRKGGDGKVVIHGG